MFRGKESSNRIELSRLVQDLLNFGVLGSLQLQGLKGVGGWGWGWLWGTPHTCAHACTCTHAHTCVVNMIISCKWPPLWVKSQGIPYNVKSACVHVCMHVCACVCTWVGCTLSPPPTPSTHPATPQGGTPGIIQNSIALELIKIFQFCLKI